MSADVPPGAAPVSPASVVVHGIRGRFAALQPFLELLLDESAGELTELQRECLEAVARNVERLFVTTSDLLALLRADLDALPLHTVPSAAVDLLRAGADLHDRSPVAGRVGVDALLDLPAVVVDPARTAAVLCVLMGRATRAAGQDTAEPAVRAVARPCERAGDMLCLAVDSPVCPTDCPPKEGDHASDPKLLDPGLFLCHQIAVRQGGWLWIDLEPAAGGAACLAVPMVDGAAPERDRGLPAAGGRATR